MPPSGPHVIFTSWPGGIGQTNPRHRGPADILIWPSGYLRKLFLPTGWTVSNSRLFPDNHAPAKNKGSQAPRGPQLAPRGFPRRAGFFSKVSASHPLQPLSLSQLPPSREPRRGRERRRGRSAPLQAQGTRLHLHARSSHTPTAAPKPTPQPSDHLCHLRQAHGPGGGGSAAVSRESAWWYLLPLSCLSLPAPRLIARLPLEGGSLGRGGAVPARVPGLGRSAWPPGRLAFRAAVGSPTGPGPFQVDGCGPE